MTAPQVEIQLIAMVVAVACAIPGTFLVLRKMAMITDAISHSILPGIVIGFFITQDISSPWLVLLAAISGVFTVVLVEAINKTGLVKEDTAIGLVFPALFSIGVILISRYAGNIHIDTHAVLLGELAFAPFNRLTIAGIDIGPKALWVMTGVLFLTILLLILFYKELKISTFDTQLAASLGFTPVVLHYGLMSMTSLTAVGAFDAVGAILVVALMIVPAATAYLLTNSLSKMLWLASAIGAFSSIAGYWLAHALNASIGGSMATTLGLVFLLVYLVAPDRGLISVMIRRKRQQTEFSMLTYLLHLSNHRAQNEQEELKVAHLTDHFNWSKSKAQKVVEFAQHNNMINIENDMATLTTKGEEFTRKALGYIVSDKTNEIEAMKEDFLLFRGE